MFFLQNWGTYGQIAQFLLQGSHLCSFLKNRELCFLWTIISFKFVSRLKAKICGFMHQQWDRSSNFGTYKHWIIAPYANFNNLCLISADWSQMNENPKSIKTRRVIKHKLRTLIASLQLKLNKIQKSKTPLILISSYFFIPIYRFFDWIVSNT
jgi:hypothetical protein